MRQRFTNGDVLCQVSPESAGYVMVFAPPTLAIWAWLSCHFRVTKVLFRTTFRTMFRTMFKTMLALWREVIHIFRIYGILYAETFQSYFIISKLHQNELVGNGNAANHRWDGINVLLKIDIAYHCHSDFDRTPCRAQTNTNTPSLCLYLIYCVKYLQIYIRICNIQVQNFFISSLAFPSKPSQTNTPGGWSQHIVGTSREWSKRAQPSGEEEHCQWWAVGFLPWRTGVAERCQARCSTLNNTV